MQSLIILFAACWFLLCAYKLKYCLHMVQIEGYDVKKYMEWMESRKDRVYSSQDRIYTVIMTVNALFFVVAVMRNSTANLYPYAMASSIFTSFFLLLGTKTKYESKKPLVFTSRAKRLYVTSMLLVLADFLIVLFLVKLFFHDLTRFFPLWAGLMSVVYLLCAFYSAGALYIANPIEKNINKKYYIQASQKIKNMKRLKSLGITGSYGKTSTKFFAATIIGEKFKVLNTPESYNTPMGISKVINNDLTDDYDVFIAELGATKVGDIDEVAKLTNPQIGIITSIGPCHLESFRSIDNIMRTKYELIENLPDDGVAIFNYDNEHVRKLADKTFKEKILYGIENIEDTNVFATNIRVSSKGSVFSLSIDGLGTIDCETKLLGEHNIHNILAAAAAAKVLGLSLVEIKQGIAKIESVEHRLQLIDPGTGVIVIDDAFNSNPDGVKAALEVLDSFTDNRKIIVTPGMVELGEIEEAENEKFGELIANVCNVAILIGRKRTLPIYNGIMKKGFSEDNLYVVDSLDQASKLLGTLTRAGDVVLFENDLPDTYDEK